MTTTIAPVRYLTISMDVQVPADLIGLEVRPGYVFGPDGLEPPEAFIDYLREHMAAAAERTLRSIVAEHIAGALAHVTHSEVFVQPDVEDDGLF